MSVPDAVSIRELDDEAVVLNAETGRYFGLDQSAVVFWRVLCEQPTRERAIAALGSRFDVSEPTLAADLDDFCDELEARGLISRDVA